MHRIVSLILGLKIKVQKADLSHWNLLKGVGLLFSGLGSSFLLELIMTPHKFSTSNCGIIMFATQNSVLSVPPPISNRWCFNFRPKVKAILDEVTQ